MSLDENYTDYISEIFQKRKAFLAQGIEDTSAGFSFVMDGNGVQCTSPEEFSGYQRGLVYPSSDSPSNDGPVEDGEKTNSRSISPRGHGIQGNKKLYKRSLIVSIKFHLNWSNHRNLKGIH